MRHCLIRTDQVQTPGRLHQPQILDSERHQLCGLGSLQLGRVILNCETWHEERGFVCSISVLNPHQRLYLHFISRSIFAALLAFFPFRLYVA